MKDKVKDQESEGENGSSGPVEANVQKDEGHVKVELKGRLDAQNTGRCWRELEEILEGPKVKSLEVDVSNVEVSGAAGAALLRCLAEGDLSHGVKADLRGLSKETTTILDTFSVEDYQAPRPEAPRLVSVPTEAGAWTRALCHDLREQVAFIGSVTAALPSALLHPKQMRWVEVRRVMETAGANALPVVGLVSALVGVVTVLEAARPLEKFGAQIFLADMIGFSSLRDTGPIVTAILLAGRSGSAFAAELGTMKVTQELDALTTMGLDPLRFLVIQRVTAALLLTPLLSLFAMLISILGGMVVMRSLGFPPLMIFNQLLTRVDLTDVRVGLTKAVIFGLIIGSVACLKGLQTGPGPSAVGASATRSVVACIVLIILSNTLISTLDYFWPE